MTISNTVVGRLEPDSALGFNVDFWHCLYPAGISHWSLHVCAVCVKQVMWRYESFLWRVKWDAPRGLIAQGLVYRTECFQLMPVVTVTLFIILLLADSHPRDLLLVLSSADTIAVCTNWVTSMLLVALLFPIHHKTSVWRFCIISICLIWCCNEYKVLAAGVDAKKMNFENARGEMTYWRLTKDIIYLISLNSHNCLAQ